MKLLLTSAGITNNSIANTLINLVDKNINEIKIGFVPNAVYGNSGNKDWYIKQLTDLKKFGFDWIDIVNITAPDIDWRSKLNEVDVIYVGCGNTFYLLDQVRKSCFKEYVEDNLKKKVYVGASAGSIIITPKIDIVTVEPANDNFINMTDLTGMNLVDFEISPHRPEIISYENIRKYKIKTKNRIYAIDDNTAIKVINEKVEIISEGKYIVL